MKGGRPDLMWKIDRFGRFAHSDRVVNNDGDPLVFMLYCVGVVVDSMFCSRFGGMRCVKYDDIHIFLVCLYMIVVVSEHIAVLRFCFFV